jgi:predicted RNA-binding Zn ribbon-like protein
VTPVAILTCTPFSSGHYYHIQLALTGEKYHNPENPQPGGREPAPGELALAQAFLNTRFDLTAEGAGEILVSAEALRDWLAARQLINRQRRIDAHDLDRAMAVREGLRALAFANNDQALNQGAIDAMRRASKGAGTQIRIEPDGPRFVTDASTGIDAALGALFAITARAMIDGTWQRLKACPGRHCGWAFYDHSRNQSARWCSMKVCGDREKARAYYQRKTGRTP